MRYLRKFNEGMFDRLPDDLLSKFNSDGIVQLSVSEFERLEYWGIQETIEQSEHQILDESVERFSSQSGLALRRIQTDGIETNKGFKLFVRLYEFGGVNEIIIRKYDDDCYLVESRLPMKGSNVTTTKMYLCDGLEGIKKWSQTK